MENKTQYLFRYFNAAGGVLRLHLKPCADDFEAFAFLATVKQDYDRFEVCRGDAVVWSGPRLAARGLTLSIDTLRI
ncbi:MAG TPA: hypothetical protein VHU18_13085 [Rhizomicrobium sp.]|jgi:hypothetical protein|nr:hypothetical protein [Rhizomicrobium sp.]